jgi:hypothetical protein
LSFAFLNTNRQNELYEISNNFKTQHSFMYTCGYEGIKLRYGQVISITWVIRNVLTGLNDKRKSIILKQTIQLLKGESTQNINLQRG